jgi:hypothetical protein
VACRSKAVEEGTPEVAIASDAERHGVDPS